MASTPNWEDDNDEDGKTWSKDWGYKGSGKYKGSTHREVSSRSGGDDYDEYTYKDGTTYREYEDGTSEKVSGGK